jgi:hypothetical protein
MTKPKSAASKSASSKKSGTKTTAVNSPADAVNRPAKVGADLGQKKGEAPPPTMTPSNVAVSGAVPLAVEAGVTDHVPAALPATIDDLERGSHIEKKSNEVVITTPIAGGHPRVFSGATFADALDSMHKFLRGESLTLDTASPQEKQAVADANEAVVRTMKAPKPAQRDDLTLTPSNRSKSGAKRR